MCRWVTWNVMLAGATFQIVQPIIFQFHYTTLSPYSLSYSRKKRVCLGQVGFSRYRHKTLQHNSLKSIKFILHTINFHLKNVESLILNAQWWLKTLTILSGIPTEVVWPLWMPMICTTNKLSIFREFNSIGILVLLFSYIQTPEQLLFNIPFPKWLLFVPPNDCHPYISKTSIF